MNLVYYILNLNTKSSNSSAKKGRLIEKYMSLLFEEIPFSPKLEVCGQKEVDIRNQRPRLRMNRLILVEKAGGGL